MDPWLVIYFRFLDNNCFILHITIINCIIICFVLQPSVIKQLQSSVSDKEGMYILIIYILPWAKKRSPVSGQRSASISVLWRAFIFIFFFSLFGNFFSFWKYVIHLHAGTKFPMYKVWWLREVSQIGQTFIYPFVKKSFKTQMQTRASEATRAETRNRRQFWP